MYRNIDKSAFRKGQYVGYAIGKVWRVYQDRSSRLWYATAEGRVIQGDSLGAISNKLAALKAIDALANPFAA